MLHIEWLSTSCCDDQFGIVPGASISNGSLPEMEIMKSQMLRFK